MNLTVLASTAFDSNCHYWAFDIEALQSVNPALLLGALANHFKTCSAKFPQQERLCSACRTIWDTMTYIITHFRRFLVVRILLMLYKKYKGKILAPSNILSYLSARSCFRYSLLQKNHPRDELGTGCLNPADSFFGNSIEMQCFHIQAALRMCRQNPGMK